MNVSDVPELLSEWNNELNAGLSPDQITLSNKIKKIRWVCSNCGNIWTASAYRRFHLEMGCPECDPKTHSLKYRQNRLPSGRSLAALYPDIAAEWHPTLNGHLLPTEVAPYHRAKVWWKCSTCGSDFCLSPSSRVADNQKCKLCAPKAKHKKEHFKNLKPGVNDLASQRPDLLEEWDYEMNAGICTPDRVTTGNSKFKIHWICKTCGHRWQTTAYNRATMNTGCRKCARRNLSVQQRLNAVEKGVNDVASQRPDLINEWDYEKNAAICAPDEISISSSTGVHWICAVCGYKWQASPHSRIHKGTGCRKCYVEKLKKNK